MTQQKFKTGDEVHHKSGGPKMVVKEYDPPEGEDVTCEWFDSKGMPQEKSFAQDVLKSYKSPIRYTTRLP